LVIVKKFVVNTFLNNICFDGNSALFSRTASRFLKKTNPISLKNNLFNYFFSVSRTSA
jgi:hypothetical protein